MLFSSPIFSQASGSVAGLTFAHCRAGMTVRSRSTPTNPNTQRQRTVKYALARLAPYWGELLTQSERDAWNLYGANVVMTNVLGQPFHLTGQNHFLRTNIPRMQFTHIVLETAPTVFDLGTFTAPTIFSMVEFTQNIRIAFDNTDDWATTDGSFLIGYGGRPTSPGREFYGGPWRFMGIITGSVFPPGSPHPFIAPWPISAGQNCWVLIRIIQVDGRLSLPIVLGPHVVTA